MGKPDADKSAGGAATRPVRQRRRRLWVGANVVVAVAFALTLTVLLNLLSSRYYLRWDLSCRDHYRLSDRTRSLLASLDEDISAVAFFGKGHPLYEDIRNLLREYEYASRRGGVPRLSVRMVDPNRDLVAARTLSDYHGVSNETDLVVFEAAGRRRIVELGELVDVHETIDYGRVLDGRITVGREQVGFKGEQAFSSAIVSVLESVRPVVYFLEGHGERGVDDYDEQLGYSGLARALHRDNIQVRGLLLAREGSIPADCSALVIAAPQSRLAQAEVDEISAYLARNGRVMMLLDSGTETGLEPLLLGWGVELGADVVVDPTRTWRGTELFVTEYGSHPSMRGLAKLCTLFYLPRAVVPVGGGGDEGDLEADRPRVSVLAGCTREGWGERDLSQSPARFDQGIDRPGPVPVAVAVERGPVDALDVELRPTRLAVIGDSVFVANAALESGLGGNRDFFMSVLSWLLERDQLLGIGPRSPRILHLELTRSTLRQAYLLIVLVFPGCAALAGCLVWWRRRR